MVTIGIIAKPHHPRIHEVIEGLFRWAADRGARILLDQETVQRESSEAFETASKKDLVSEAGLIVVLGGDGTLLSAVRAVGARETPILGINMGSMGFLTAFTLDELYPALNAIREGGYEVEERLMLSADLVRQDRVVHRYTALNDCVLNTGALARITDLDVTIGETYVTKFTADGLIVSTPTGSTAYSLSAGGPIVQPDLGAIILTPICPHILTNRPLVLTEDAQLRIDLLNGSDVSLTVDGQVGAPMETGDSVRIRKSRHVTRLVQPLAKNHFLLLREKLKWGER